MIDGLCYGDGQVNPLNPCQVCDPTAVGDAGVMDWADNDGVSCDGRDLLQRRRHVLGGACASPPATRARPAVRAAWRTGTSAALRAWRVYGPVCNSAGDVVDLDDCGDEMLVEDCPGLDLQRGAVTTAPAAARRASRGTRATSAAIT